MLLHPIRGSLAAISFSLLLGPAAPARGGMIYDKQWDPDLYGHLDQHSTDCSDLGCGPTAAVNSFVFLQNKYPDIYGMKLTGDTYDSWMGTANELLDQHYMDCDCGPGGSGTNIADFISGKEKYLNEFAPGTTEVHAQNFHDPANPIKPTWQFLFDQLEKGQDIEVLVGFYDESGRHGGHYLTINGFSFGDTNGDGLIDDDESAGLSYIDPSDGAAHSGFLGMKDDFLDLINYTQGFDTYIEATVAESPIPEPPALFIFIAGFMGAWLIRGRNMARRQRCVTSTAAPTVCS